MKFAFQRVLPVLLLLVLPDASPAQVDTFSVETIHYTGGRYNDSPIAYRIYIPKIATHDDVRALFVWLHGAGEVGDNNRGQLAEIYGFMGLERGDTFGDFVVALQCPSDNSSWYQRSGENREGLKEIVSDNKGDEMITVLRAIIGKTMDEHPIDPDRVYLMGLCSGGVACWEMALRYPELFAAMCTLADQGVFDERSKRIRQLPIWSFHSTGDAPEGLRRTIGNLKRLGGNCYLTEIPTDSHDCWTSAFFDYDLRGWLLAQRRGNATACPPGTMTWRSRWNVLRRDYLRADFIFGNLFIPLVAILSVKACMSEIRRRWHCEPDSGAIEVT